MSFATIEDAIAAIGQGEIVVVVDDEDRENEGDLIMAAEAATPGEDRLLPGPHLRRDLRATPAERADELELPLMVTNNTESQRTAFTVSVDYRHGTTTGISAEDRTSTINALIDPHTRPAELNRPGHIFPLALPPGRRAQAGRAHRGHHRPGGGGGHVPGRRAVRARVRGQDRHGQAARARALRRRCTGCCMISIADLIRYRRRKDKLVRRIAGPGPHPHRVTGNSTATSMSRCSTVSTTSPSCCGDIGERGNVLVRVHSECLTGDVFGSLRCDCGPQLARSDPPHRRRGHGRDRVPARPRGPGHRVGPQAARLQPAGAGPRHGRRQPGARDCRSTAASTASARRSSSTWA